MISVGSVAVSGSTIVVGEFDHASEAGRAYVFTKGAMSWRQVAELVGSDTVAGDGFGVSVAISGGTVGSWVRARCVRRRPGVPVHEGHHRLAPVRRTGGLWHRRWR